MVSGQSFGSGAVTLPCITSMCSVQRFFWWPLSSFSLWIILLPLSLPRFIFKLINQFDRCLVPLAWGLMAGGCRFANYGGVTLSRGWLCQKWKPLDIPGTHLHYVTVVNFVFNCTRTGAPITTGTYQNARWYPIYSVEDDIYHLCLTSPGVFNSFGFCQVETFVSVLQKYVLPSGALCSVHGVLFF